LGRNAKFVPNEQLISERERRNWTQEQVANQIGSTPLNVGRWERGEAFPRPYTRRKLCILFNKSAEELGLIKENYKPRSVVEEEIREYPPSDINSDVHQQTFETGDSITQQADSSTLASTSNTPTSYAHPSLPLVERYPRISRRAVILGLAGVTAVGMASGITWLVRSQKSPLLSTPDLLILRPLQLKHLYLRYPCLLLHGLLLRHML